MEVCGEGGGEGDCWIGVGSWCWRRHLDRVGEGVRWLGVVLYLVFDGFGWLLVGIDIGERASEKAKRAPLSSSKKAVNTRKKCFSLRPGRLVGFLPKCLIPSEDKNSSREKRGDFNTTNRLASLLLF